MIKKNSESRWIVNLIVLSLLKACSILKFMMRCIIQAVITLLYYRKLVESPALRDFTTVRAFIDGDVEQADQYTVSNLIDDSMLFNAVLRLYHD